MSNNVAQKMSFSMAMSTDGYKKAIANALQEPGRAARFIAGITSAVANNKELQACEPATILSGALLGESLGLSPSPQLGQYYLVPFKDNKNNRVCATFVLGYKGYVQLAIRSGRYRNIAVSAIKKGELSSYNPITGEAELSPILDGAARAAAPTIGYYALLEHKSGFRKALYWDREKMEAHAMKYSAGYKAKKGYTFWEKDFDGMACKTMLRQILSKWGDLSGDCKAAYALERDNTIALGMTPDAGYIGAEDAPEDDFDAPDNTPVDEPEGDFDEVSLADL